MLYCNHADEDLYPVYDDNNDVDIVAVHTCELLADAAAVLDGYAEFTTTLVHDECGAHWRLAYTMPTFVAPPLGTEIPYDDELPF